MARSGWSQCKVRIEKTNNSRMEYKYSFPFKTCIYFFLSPSSSSPHLFWLFPTDLTNQISSWGQNQNLWQLNLVLKEKQSFCGIILMYKAIPEWTLPTHFVQARCKPSGWLCEKLFCITVSVFNFFLMNILVISCTVGFSTVDLT